MGDLGYRLSIMFLNVLFPPLAILIMCGAEMTFAVNAILWCCAIIPSHIHGFYVSCVYFHRRRKVRKGIYPGGSKPLIYSEHVLNGGANKKDVNRLYWVEKGDPRRTKSRRSAKSRSGNGSVVSELHRQQSYVSHRSEDRRLRPRHPSRSSTRAGVGHAQYLAQDGYSFVR